jgi:hypothetical protein
MALGAPSPVEHPGGNLQEAVCLRTVQCAAEKHAIGLLDDRVNPHFVRKPGMMCVQNLTPDGLVGVLKPCCTTDDDRIRALTTAPRIKPTSIFRRSARRPNPGRGSTYRRGIFVQTTGTSSVDMVGIGSMSCTYWRPTKEHLLEGTAWIHGFWTGFNYVAAPLNQHLVCKLRSKRETKTPMG